MKPLYVTDPDLESFLDDLIAEDDLDFDEDHPTYISELELPKLYLITKSNSEQAWYLN